MTAETKNMVITGASRGIGLEFCRRFLEAGHQVHALARTASSSPGLAGLAGTAAGRLHLSDCDVGDDASVRAAAERIGKSWDRVDLLLNNAGVYGPRNTRFETVKLEDIRAVFEINTLGPVRLSRALLPLLRQAGSARLVHITSLMGSIEDNGSGGAWPYRLSKTALNMASRNMAHELAADGIISVVLHPGWVSTDMGGDSAPLSVEKAVESMVETIGRLGGRQNGSFLDRNGEPVPW